MMYRNYNTGEIIDEAEATNYIDNEFQLLNDEDGDTFEEWLSDNYTRVQIFNLDRIEKEEANENFLDFLCDKAEEAFLKNWEEIDDEEE